MLCLKLHLKARFFLLEVLSLDLSLGYWKNTYWLMIKIIDLMARLGFKIEAALENEVISVDSFSKFDPGDPMKSIWLAWSLLSIC